MAGLLAGFLLLKAAVLLLLARQAEVPGAERPVFALLLAQGGEFAFVVFQQAAGLKVIDEAQTSVLIGTVALSMLLTPLLLLVLDRRARRRERAAEPLASPHALSEPQDGPVIIAGFGRYGQIVGRLLAANGIAPTVLDHDAEQVAALRRFGFRVHYGDATRPDLLRTAGADTARVLVVAIDDVEQSLKLVDLAREHFPHLVLVARARNVRHWFALRDRGVTLIERETLDASLASARSVLEQLGWTPQEAGELATRFRAHSIEQLEQLWPHQLIMTAMPIPRTLAMTAYADLDTSVIDELPPGRTPVTTVAIPDTRRTDIIDRVRHACITEGRQAYWVCTLIEESELLEAQAAEATWEELKLALPELNVGLVHGRMKPAEKQAVMASFKQGELHLLVATTVIEVGVDVPNASLMIIENPERLGLAQLHQLRGRVGRGAVASHCVLLYKTPLSKTAQIRLQVLRDSNDGFVIAQKDLEIRGPGELLGTRQTGNAEFKVADLLRDQAMIPEVQRLARHIHERYPQQAKALIERWMPETERYSNA